MAKAHLQEINGTVMLALPATVLDHLRLTVGSEVEVEVRDRTLVLGDRSRRGRYSLDDLLAESDPSAFEQTDEDREFLNSPPVGRELI
jgi:antitoxin component of MazEF toxin-antitoxin module